MNAHRTNENLDDKIYMTRLREQTDPGELLDHKEAGETYQVPGVD